MDATPTRCELDGIKPIALHYIELICCTGLYFLSRVFDSCEFVDYGLLAVYVMRLFILTSTTLCI